MNDMLKVDEQTLEHMEEGYPGIRETILRFDEAVLPTCSHCGSENTAEVQSGIIGRTINIAAATTKVKMVPIGTRRSEYYCNACKEFFG